MSRVKFEAVELDPVLAAKKPAAKLVNPSVLGANRACPARGRILAVAKSDADRKWVRLHG